MFIFKKEDLWLALEQCAPERGKVKLGAAAARHSPRKQTEKRSVILRHC
jgi:hypothetical protein